MIEESTAFARWTFERSTTQKDGASTQEHLDSIKNNPFTPQSIKEKVEEEEPPSLPEESYYAWSYFIKLHNTRGQGGLGGFLPITYTEMYNYFMLEQIYPEPFEIELIKAFDNIFLEVQHEEMKREERKNKNK